MRVKRDGGVLEPASGTFDVTVAPGEGVQAAVDRCPPGGCVLLLPGTHEGPLTLRQEVHVFGRGLATLWTATGTVVSSEADSATLDGLFIRREAGGTSNSIQDCVWVKGGQLQLQACEITSIAGSWRLASACARGPSLYGLAFAGAGEGSGL